MNCKDIRIVSMAIAASVAGSFVQAQESATKYTVECDIHITEADHWASANVGDSMVVRYTFDLDANRYYDIRNHSWEDIPKIDTDVICTDYEESPGSVRSSCIDRSTGRYTEVDAFNGTKLVREGTCQKIAYIPPPASKF